MTSLTIELPEALAKRVQKTGVLQSPEVLELIEQLAARAEEQPPQKGMRLIDRLGLPPGVADIDVEFPRSRDVARPVNLS